MKNNSLLFVCAVSIVFSCPHLVGARTWSFDAAQLNGVGGVDISLFEQGGQLPGRYPVDILLNGERIDSQEMDFHQEKDVEGKPFLKTCLTKEQLIRYGIKVDDWVGLFEKDNDSISRQCANLSAIPQATEEFQFNSQQLLLSIPQVALRPKLKGIAPVELWNDGVSAFLMNYRLNTSRSESRGNSRSTHNAQYVQLAPGVNVGAWRLRNLTTWRKQGEEHGKWQTAYLYAERGLYNTKSRLTLGERYTPSDVFDSVPFRGGMIGTDDAMVPYNQREYAPLVHGIARTQARIEVRQNGYVIYSNTVAPGPFELTDLSSSGSGGDLLVTVVESDGENQEFTVPWTTPPVSLRQGYLKYNLMAGQYRPAHSSVQEAPVVQASLMYGLPWDLTAYGGFQWAEHYQSAALGIGVSLGAFGALSIDGIQAQGQKQNGEGVRGQTWRARYSKRFEATNTGVSLASYQHASPGYNSLSGVLDTYRSDTYGHFRDNEMHRTSSQHEKRRTRTSLTLSQSLAGWGYLNLTGSRETYWHGPQHKDELTASYGTSFKGISWSLNWTQRKHPAHYGFYRNRNEQEFSLWMSMPLDRWLGNNTRTSYQIQSGNQRDTQYLVGVNGDAFERKLRWDVQEQMSPGSRSGYGDSSVLNLTWYDTYGELEGGYSYSRNSRQMNAGLAGGVVVHPHGTTFGQPLGNTVALVEAPGASGVSVGSYPGVKTDFRGYTTLGYVTPYQENIVTLDPTTLSQDVELAQTDTRVVPTAGAIIPATFTPRTGGRAVITLKHADGKPVPFGAVASISGTDSERSVAGIVGDGGEVYMSGLPEKGQLQVSWGSGSRQCRVNYQLPADKGNAGIYNMTGVCQ